MKIDEVLDSLQEQDEGWRVEVPKSWMQGRTIYGGLVAALALRAMRRGLEVGAPLLSMDVGFLAPAAGVVEVKVDLLRSGRYVTHASADVFCEGVLVTRIYGVFGERRESGIEVSAGPATPAMAREEGTEFPFMKGLTPEFMQHFDYVLTEGAFPFSGASEGVVGGYFRYGDEVELSGEERALGLADAWPPAVLPMGSKPFFGSTVRWSCHFVGEVLPVKGDDYWWHRAETLASGGGYATVTERLYYGEELVCWSEQLVAVFDG